MSVHLFQQLITDVYKYACTSYAYIIYKKVQTYRQPYRQSWTKYYIDRCRQARVYYTKDWLSMSVGMLLFWGFTDILSVCSVVYWLAKCLSLDDWLVRSALIMAVYVSVDSCWNGVFCWLAEYQDASVDSCWNGVFCWLAEYQDVSVDGCWNGVFCWLAEYQDVSVDSCWNGVFCWLAEYQYLSVDDWLFWSFTVWVQMRGWFSGTLIAWVCVCECGWLVEWCFLLIGWVPVCECRWLVVSVDVWMVQWYTDCLSTCMWVWIAGGMVFFADWLTTSMWV